jgi:hypothetical protein
MLRHVRMTRSSAVKAKKTVAMNQLKAVLITAPRRCANGWKG